MSLFLKITVCALIGYLLGSVSTGVIVCKLFGNVDIRTQGSGNIGMTNVMRTMGWLPSFLTFAGDALKGILGALAGQFILGDLGLQIGGFFAVIGHNWPLYFGFKGGKGMSTSFGYILITDWRVALILLGVQLIIVLTTRLMSAASLATAVLIIPVTILLDRNNTAFIVSAIMLGLMAILSHRQNIRRLISGNENRLNAKQITNTSKSVIEKLKNRRKH